MKRMIKYAAAASVAGVFALGMALPSQAAQAHSAALGYGGAPAMTNTAYHNDSYVRASYGHNPYEAPGYDAYDYVRTANSPGKWSTCVQPGFYHRYNYAACY